MWYTTSEMRNTGTIRGTGQGREARKESEMNAAQMQGMRQMAATIERGDRKTDCGACAFTAMCNRIDKGQSGCPCFAREEA